MLLDLLLELDVSSMSNYVRYAVYLVVYTFSTGVTGDFDKPNKPKNIMPYNQLYFLIQNIFLFNLRVIINE